MALLLLLLGCAIAKFAPGYYYSAKYDSKANQWFIADGKGGIAEGIWEETRYQTGWDTLRVWTNEGESNEQQAYAAGFLEGALTQPLIFDAWRSDTNGSGPLPPKVVTWMKANDQWTRTQVKLNPSNPYWVQVGLVIQQSDGLLAGYNLYSTKSQQMSPITWLGYQYGPELGDVFSAVGETDFHISRPRKQEPNFLDSHCSALIKLTDDGKQLWTSQDTWSGFSEMLRMYKFFDTPFSVKSNIASMQYSSYPGYIPSGDDFYITSANLVVQETTNSILNNTLYDYVVPQNVMYWIRVTVANRMANSGAEWSNTFALYNSGTYNNQWMIVDYKQFTPGQSLRSGTLWIAEQIPGKVESADMTSVLQSTGYWASYNIPYFPTIYNMSGYPSYKTKYGDEYSYQNCARAKIFRRDQSSVKDMDTMKHMMRYNQYQTDALSLQDACRGISARCDLNVPWVGQNSLNGWSAFGAIDSKITNYEMAAKMTSVAVAGPTWDAQPPFAWTDEWKYTPHWSQPQVFNFDYVPMVFMEK